MLTHRNLVANALHKTIACGLRADDVFLAAAPFFHVAGTAPVLSLVWLGGSLVVLPGFEAAACLDMIERHGVTVAMPVPTMLAALVEEQSSAPSRRVVAAAHRARRLADHDGPDPAGPRGRSPHVELAQYYGATETAAIVTCLGHEERHLDGGRLGSCGQPVVGVAVDVLDAAGRPCAPGDVGEIVVRGPNVTRGYWEDDAATAAAFVDGWYRMGDVGYVDEERYLWLLDRSTDMIVTGGENVYSIEVEEVLSRHPARASSARCSACPTNAGCRPSTPSSSWTPRSWRRRRSPTSCAQHCRASIAGFKVPKRIELRTDPLPKSGPGKVQKRHLREAYREAASG